MAHTRIDCMLYCQSAEAEQMFLRERILYSSYEVVLLLLIFTRTTQRPRPRAASVYRARWKGKGICDQEAREHTMNYLVYTEWYGHSHSHSHLHWWITKTSPLARAYIASYEVLLTVIRDTKAIRMARQCRDTRRAFHSRRCRLFNWDSNGRRAHGC